MGREEIYIRYIYHLGELHHKSSNWVEAGFTLLLHAQLLQVWNELSCTVALQLGHIMYKCPKQI